MNWFFILMVLFLLGKEQPHLQLSSLDDFSVSGTQEIQNIRYWMVFQPGCSVCEKQIQDLSCLPPHQVAFLGAYGDEESLRAYWKKIKKRYKLKHSAYMVDETLKKNWELPEHGVTPLWIVGKENPRKIQGLQSCNDLKSISF